MGGTVPHASNTTGGVVQSGGRLPVKVAPPDASMLLLDRSTRVAGFT